MPKAPKFVLNGIFFTELSQHFQAIIISSKRRRRRRISITAGWAAEGSEACGHMNDGKIVLEEGEHKQAMQIFRMFALFEDDLTIILWTAGFAAFGSSTSGYGYSPPLATFAWAFPPSCFSRHQDGARGRLFGVTGWYKFFSLGLTIKFCPNHLQR